MKANILVMLAFTSLVRPVPAQVPHVINYQGSISINGTDYDGPGEFKFAFVNAEGTTTFWSNDGSSIHAREPATATPIAVSQGDYSVLLGDTTLTNMTDLPPAVFANPDLWLRVWFSDATNGFQHVAPDQRIAAVAYAMIAVNVSDGAITSAKLARGAVTTEKLAPNSITAASIAPRSIGPAQLALGAAEANLLASGGLILSDSAAPTNLLAKGFTKMGAMTVEGDAWKKFKFFIPTPRYGHTAIWTGTEMIVLVGGYSGLPLQGGVRYNPSTETWVPLITPDELVFQTGVWTGSELLLWGTASGRGLRYNPATGASKDMAPAPAGLGVINASVVWTGKEMIVCCGTTAKGALVHRAAGYNPPLNEWRTLALPNTPSGRQYQAAIWTGREMIVWGGHGSVNVQRTTGVRYDPALDVWTPVSTNNAPSGRDYPGAVWTGKEMIIWGGTGNSLFPSKDAGRRYDPATDSWQSMSTNNAPRARSSHTMIWTGKEMIIWGGVENGGDGRETGDGAGYDPVSDSWRILRNAQAPLARSFHSAIWTGDEMIIWGGGSSLAAARIARDQSSASSIQLEAVTAQAALVPRRSTGVNPINSGARYRPDTDSWRPINVPLAGRIGHTVVWTGREAIVWGGRLPSSFGFTVQGGRFNPITGRWSATSLDHTPEPRHNHTAVWTGAEMVVWGGDGIYGSGAVPIATGGRYDPVLDRWFEVESSGAPSPRNGHSAVWSGTEMIIWGGTSRTNGFFSPSGLVNTGARYNPRNNSWTSLAADQTHGAPAPRREHVAVWTGSEMIIWGGLAQNGNPTNLISLNTGSRYDPQSNTWKPMSTLGAPHSGKGVWSGRELVVWNGTEGGRYNPASDTWEPLANEFAAPSISLAAWTGSEMFAWGGTPGATGARYNPDTDAWVFLSKRGAPPGRVNSAGVWIGSEFLIFGGVANTESFVALDSVLSYSPTKQIYLFGKP
ncbi:MAG: hypothetical protein HY043_10455 [Verrucomicrobia bacterium]|nr:hypothetical protein [Verrucomicrobiota bacterium]